MLGTPTKLAGLNLKLDGKRKNKTMPKQREYYTISKVVGHREGDSGIEFKVHWAGYPSSEDTWEPESNLEHCQEYIQEYIMSNLKGQRPRRSARLANVPAPIIFSEEEEIISTPVKAKKPRKTKTPSQPKPKAKPKPDTPAVIVLAPQDPTPSYSLRVLRQPDERPSPTSTSYGLRSTRRSDFSSDEEDFSSVQRVVKKMAVRTGPKHPTGRMGLSETRFRNQIADIEKRKYASSTPLSAGSTTRSTRSSKRLNNNTLETTTTTITRKQSGAQECEDDTISGGTATTEEEEEEVVTIVTTKKRSTREGTAWQDIGWKEVALAGFLASVGVLGYICYASDLCSYC